MGFGKHLQFAESPAGCSTHDCIYSRAEITIKTALAPHRARTHASPALPPVLVARPEGRQRSSGRNIEGP